MTDFDADWVDGIQDFFDALKVESMKNPCYPEANYAAELLKARGFLLEDTQLALSDNSHRNDAWFLNLLLQIFHLGEVKDGKIFIRPDANVEKIFFIDNRIGGEAFCDRRSWKIFVNTNFAPKIEVRLLEPFIARYVKAISACSVNTWCSCDGNHPSRNGQRILVDFVSAPDVLWHEIICERLLRGRFNLNWVHEDTAFKIEFTEATKWQTYTELNLAGKFLYDNRIKLRQIRREASDAISLKMLKTLSDAELAQIFSERANKLFDELFNDI